MTKHRTMSLHRAAKHRAAKHLGLIVLGAALVGCTQPEPEPVAQSQDALIESFVNTGLSPRVAACVAGWSVRFDMETPALGLERSDGQQLLLDEATQSCITADALLNPTAEPAEPIAFVDEPSNYGDDTELDRLWDSCEAGDGHSCDELWELAPIGSSYEEFGVTCGNRADVLDCSEELLPDLED